MLHFNHLRISYQCWNQVGSTGSCFVWVIWVRPALKIIRVWPGLDQVWRKIKKYTIWRCNDADIRSSWVTPTFVIVLWCQLVYESHTPFCMHICTKIWPFTGLYKAMPINRLLLQPSRSATLVVFHLHMGMLLCKSHALDLHKATPTFSKHVIVLVNLHFAGATHYTPTDPSLYLLVIMGIQGRKLW